MCGSYEINMYTKFKWKMHEQTKESLYTWKNIISSFKDIDPNINKSEYVKDAIEKCIRDIDIYINTIDKRENIETKYTNRILKKEEPIINEIIGTKYAKSYGNDNKYLAILIYMIERYCTHYERPGSVLVRTDALRDVWELYPEENNISSFANMSYDVPHILRDVNDVCNRLKKSKERSSQKK